MVLSAFMGLRPFVHRCWETALERKVEFGSRISTRGEVTEANTIYSFRDDCA